DNLAFAGMSEASLYNNDVLVDINDKYSKDNWDKKSFQDKLKLFISDFTYNSPSKIMFNIESEDIDGTKNKKENYFHTPYYSFYDGRKDLLTNMYYSEKPLTSITITFPERGIYTFDDVEVLCQPMDNYEENVTALKEDVLENVDIHANAINATNYVTGDISLDESKILLMSIPYSKGWTAYDNGQEVEILKANDGFMAIPLEPGEHSIELKYHTQGMFLGFIISVFGVVCLIVLIFYRRKQRKPENKLVKTNNN
ncbi:MAG: YfhO family protein, partial [Lachnospirales bacterium]